MSQRLKIGDFQLPLASAKQCEQKLIAFPLGEFTRTIGGGLLYLGNEQYKYKSTITAVAQNVPALAAISPGDKIWIGCIQHLVGQAKKDIPHVFARPPVKETIFAYDFKGKKVDFTHDDHEAILSKDGFISYCPWLHMVVCEIVYEIAEWNLSQKWRLDLLEC